MHSNPPRASLRRVQLDEAHYRRRVKEIGATLAANDLDGILLLERLSRRTRRAALADLRQESLGPAGL